jgi:F0F1-type ATP synthase delta subunit
MPKKNIKSEKTTIKSELTRKVSALEETYSVQVKVILADNLTEDECSEIAIAIGKAIKSDPVIKVHIQHSDSKGTDIVLDPDQQTIELPEED